MYSIIFWFEGSFQTRNFSDVKRAFGALKEMIRDGVKDAYLLKGEDTLVSVTNGEVNL